MIDSVEDYWDVANIMMNGRFAATKFNDGSEGQTLEELFFAITEGAPVPAFKNRGILPGRKKKRHVRPPFLYPAPKRTRFQHLLYEKP